jgi:hypothetical protein
VSATTVYGPSTVRRSRSARAALAALDDSIIAAVETEHPVTLRGVFYRVVSAGDVAKTELGYRQVGRELLKLRRAGAIPYDWITDGTRWISKPDTYDDLDQMLEDAHASYRRALWRDQAAEVQIYSEKDAISGVVLPVTERWDVPLGIVRGYSSESFAWSVAQSVIAAAERGKHVHVYQLGDHDPSGVDAWRAFRERVVSFLGGPLVTPYQRAWAVAHNLGSCITGAMVGKPLGVGEVEADCWCDCEDGCQRGACECEGGCGCEDDCDCGCGLAGHVSYRFVSQDRREVRRVSFARLAVTERQIRDMSLPTRPTKRTDSRSAAFGDGESVEVDAIPPTVLRQIVSSAITRHIDQHQLDITRTYEAAEREALTAMIGTRQQGDGQ